MKQIILYIIFLFFLVKIHAQSPLQFTPEFGIANPTENLSGNSFRADQGEQYGLHIDWVKPGKKLGLGLYGGLRTLPYNLNSNNLPRTIDLNTFSGQLRIRGGTGWDNYLAALGPVFQLPLGKTFALRAYSKAGITQTDYYFYSEEYIFNTGEEFLVYQSSTDDEYQDNVNFTLVSGLGVQVNITPNLGITLGGSYIWVPKVSHVFTGTTADLSVQDPVLLYENLANSETKTYLAKCSANTINWTLGFRFGFGGREKPEEPQENRPNIPNLAYDCSQVEYLTPQYNQVVLLDENSNVRFQVEDANQKNVKQNQEYSIVLYKKREDGSFEQIGYSDFNKLDTKINLKAYETDSEYALYWKVISVSQLGTQNCPFDNNLMRLQVFPDRGTAEAFGACIDE
jgi:hypothetical protein